MLFTQFLCPELFHDRESFLLFFFPWVINCGLSAKSGSLRQAQFAYQFSPSKGNHYAENYCLQGDCPLYSVFFFLECNPSFAFYMNHRS